MEPGRPGQAVIGTEIGFQGVANRHTHLCADVQGVIGGIGALVAQRIRPAAIGLDLAVGDVAAGKHRPAIDDLGIQVEFGAPQIDLVDVRHHAQQAKAAHEEFEELHVADLGIIARQIITDAAIQQAALDAGFKRG